MTTGSSRHGALFRPDGRSGRGPYDKAGGDFDTKRFHLLSLDEPIKQANSGAPHILQRLTDRGKSWSGD